MQHNPVLVVDGLNVFMRHFCANPSLSSNGEHVGGFLGFLGNIGGLSESFSPKKIIIVWESGGSLRKRAVMSSYKSGRRPAALNRYYEDDIPATSTNHMNQVSLLVKAFGDLPVTQLYVRGCEADDVIGYLAKYVYKNEKIVIASSDKDLHQLIGENVVQWSPGQKRTISENDVIEKFGVSPENFVTARCFVGDSSDKIKGVKGAGFKSLSKWFPELRERSFVSHSEIISRAKELAVTKKGKTLILLADSLETANRNWRLMHLDTSCLASDQIKKILGQLENQGKSNKMSLLRLMSRHGMGNFDISRHFVAINSVRYRDNQE